MVVVVVEEACWQLWHTHARVCCRGSDVMAIVVVVIIIMSIAGFFFVYCCFCRKQEEGITLATRIST